MKGTIELSGMEFFANHGCYDFEREEGGQYLVDFSAEVDITKAAETDDLEDTLDYGEIYDIISAEMDTPSNLLEHVAGRIVKAIQREHPELEHFTLKISKLKPPVPGTVASSSVTVKI